MVYVKRKDRETAAAMLRRFSRRVQASGVLLRARKSRFYAPKLTRRVRRERALRRLAAARERERLAKLGKIPEKARRRR